MKERKASALKEYRERLRAAGFKRLACTIHPDLVALIARERKQGECQGRCLERLLLGEARLRPPFDAEGVGKGSAQGTWKAAWEAQQTARIRAVEERKAAAKAARQAQSRQKWAAIRKQARAEAEVKHGVAV